MYDVFYFYMLFIYGQKPKLSVMKTNDGVRLETVVCSKRLVAWGETGSIAINLISQEAVKIIIEDNRPYDDFEAAVWDME